MGLYLVFLFSVAFLFKNRQHLTVRKTDKIKYSLCLMMFLLHVFFGIFFINKSFFSTRNFGKKFACPPL